MLALELQRVMTGEVDEHGALLRDALSVTLFTPPIALLIAGMLMVMGRSRLSILGFRLLILPVRLPTGSIVALVAARSLFVRDWPSAS